ncbi:MAG: [NiFe]-hydrogenase assembly chaperone HybE [Notoacmeibacter sp.]|nr:[NiFe]-hydrogenase assembly chaperone HybE [Notoacmeibacter sp.]
MDAAAAIAEKFESAFERIRVERMDGVPILNPALSVVLTGLVEWNGYLAGVLVTPWFINTVLVGGDDGEAGIAPGTKKSFQFPAGPFEFIRSHEDGLGGFWMCSLFSPVFEFPDQETALAVAEGSLAALMDREAGEGEADEDMERIWRGERPDPVEDATVEASGTTPPGGDEAADRAPKAVSRRAFLTADATGDDPA